SLRLTQYPTDLLSRPLSMTSLDVTVTPGGPALTAFQPPDATPLPGVAASLLPAGAATGAGSGAGGGTADSATSGLLGAIPGGVGTELGSIVATGDLSPLVLLGSLAVAIGLGAAHALSPGHGKTIMAAYLVGTRGTARQALGLGLAVTVSHTLGVLAL